MVHSVELLFDDRTDAAVRQVWDELAGAGIRSLAGHRSPTNRPHVTLTVAETIDSGADEALHSLRDRFPLRAVVGAPMVFGGGRSVTLVRSVVPSAELLAVQADVHRMCLPHMPGGALPHGQPGHWTAHVTLARRLPLDQLATVFALPGVTRDLHATAGGLRHWDGDSHTEHRI